MIIPIIWLKDYIETEKNADEIARSFTALGLMLDKPIKDNILDLEHRMDRSDWLSILGCARDLAAMEQIKLNYPSKSTQKGNIPTPEQKIEIKVECPELVKRFNTKTFRNITVKPSPSWLKERLEAYGIPSINNIVDITNFVMVEYGQPMHAQDLDKFKVKEILIRRANDGERIVTLDGTEAELDNSMFVLTQNQAAIAIGGIVGGKETGVTETTKDIILDAGNYDQANIRHTARKLKIQNETVLRYDKFLHPKLCEVAMERATQLILDLAGGECYENQDWYPQEHPQKELTLEYSRVKQISGMDIASENIKGILQRLEYEVLEETDRTLKLLVPYFRTDVEVQDDVISDILRINNYINIPTQILGMAPPQEITPEIYEFEEVCRDAMVKLGLHEHITDPLVEAKGNNEDQILLENALSFEKNALRTTIYSTLQPVLAIYPKHDIENVGAFEIGKIYKAVGGKYEEIRVLESVFTTPKTVKKLNDEVKAVLAGFFKELGIQNVRYEKNADKAMIYQEDLLLGELRIDAFTLYTEALLKATKQNLRVTDKLINKIKEDITFEINIMDAAGQVVTTIKNADSHIENVEVVDEYPKTSDIKAITLRITFVPIDQEEQLTLETVKKIKEEKILPLLSH